MAISDVGSWKGTVGARSTGQLQGNFANPSTGQIGPTFKADIRLSIPTVSAPTHALLYLIVSQALTLTEFPACILGAFLATLATALVIADLFERFIDRVAIRLSKRLSATSLFPR